DLEGARMDCMHECESLSQKVMQIHDELTELLRGSSYPIQPFRASEEMTDLYEANIKQFKTCFRDHRNIRRLQVDIHLLFSGSIGKEITLVLNYVENSCQWDPTYHVKGTNDNK